jgi:hypothetical protein
MNQMSFEGHLSLGQTHRLDAKVVDFNLGVFRARVKV